MLENMAQIVLFPPLLLIPVHLTATTDRTPEFVWNGRFEASSYVLEIWQDGGARFVIDEGFVSAETDPQTSIAPLVRCRPRTELAPGVWHWRVRCVSGEGQSAWAVGRTFTVAEADLDAIVYAGDRQHPYLHLRPDRLVRLKERIRTHPDFTAGYQRLLAAADAIAAMPAPTEDYARASPGQHEAYTWVGGMMWNRMGVLGLAWLLTEDAKYADAGRDHLLTLAGYERWVGASFLDAERFNPIWHAALETAMTVYGMAIGYDWLHDALSEADRAVIRAAMLDKGIRPLMHAWVNPETAGRIPRHQMPGGNWAMVCACSAGVGAIALLDEVPEARDWVRQVRDRTRWWLHYEGGEYMVDDHLSGPRPKPVIGPDDANFDADGGYRETIGYMNYAMTFVNYFADGLKGVSDEDLFAHYPDNLLDPIAATLYRYQQDGRDLERIADFGDTGGAPKFDETYACLMANGSPRLASLSKALHDRITGEIPVSARSLLWYDPDRAPAPLQLPRAGKLFRGTGIVSLRTGSLRRGAHAALKTRQNRGHHDIGAIYFYSGGETWLTDSGVFDYASPIYQQFLVHTKAQNLVLVDDRNQERVDGRLESFVAGLQYGYARCEAGPTMPDRVTSWTRETVLIGPDTFLVIDRLAGKGPHRYDWLLHPGAPHRLAPGEGVVLTGGSDALHVRVIEPAAYTVEERPGYDRYIPRTTLAFTPETAAADARFVVVMTPESGEAGAAEVTAQREDHTVRVARNDLDVFVRYQPGGDPEQSAIVSDAPLALCGRDPATGAIRLLAIHGGTEIQTREGRWLKSGAPVDLCAEYTEKDLLLEVDTGDSGGTWLEVGVFDRMNGSLNGEPLVAWSDELGVLRFNVPSGRHEIAFGVDEGVLDRLKAQSAERPMARTRRDAPIFNGAAVRASSTGGDNLVQAIDGNDMSQWATLPGVQPPHWLEVTLPEPRAIRRVSLCPTHNQSMTVSLKDPETGAWVEVGGIDRAAAEAVAWIEFDTYTAAAVRVDIGWTAGQNGAAGLWEISWR